MESWKKEREKAFCYEGNEQRQNHIEKICYFSDEWKKISIIIKTPVSIFLLIYNLISSYH